MPTARHPFKKSLIGAAALLVVGAAPTESALGASCTWIPSTGNWGSAGNWSCGVVPTGPNQDSASIGSAKTVTVNTAQSIYSLVNAGTINIDAFLLTLQSGGSTINTGTINIGGPSTAALQMQHDVNNTGGSINVASGSALNQFFGTLTGGTINTTGTGALVAASSGGNFLSGVTLNGTLDLSSVANARERIVNGATINGAVNIANGGILSLDSSVGGANPMLSGNVTINMNDAGARFAIDGTGSTTLGAGVIVRGQGNLGEAINIGGNNALTNHGLISADVAGGTLSVVTPGNGGSFANAGTMRAVGGGTLNVATNVANAGGTISAGAGSAVLLSGASVSGGQLSTSGTGSIQANSSTNNDLDGVTVSGTLDLTSVANARLRIVNGATINGAVNIANGGILSMDSAAGASTQSLGGTVTINLNDAGARLAIDGTGSTTLGSGVTVRGQGNLGQAINIGGVNTLTSNGLISADVAAGTLEIVRPGNSGSFVNNGTLQAVNGATLLLSTNILAHAGSQIISGAGSNVVQNGITINGVFTSSGGGAFTATSSANNYLDTVNFTGALDLGTIANARERIINGATINGSVNISNGGILSLDSAATTGANQSLAGTVSINMNDSSARLAIDGTGTTTLGSGVTIHGQGNLGQAINIGGNNVLINNGLISADVGGGTLNIVQPGNSGSFVNNGTLRAINGATLLLSTNILANAGSQIVAGLGSSVVQNGVTVNGVVTTTGGGVFTASSSTNNYLDAVSFAGSLDLGTIANARERIINGATINGSVAISNGGILSMDSAAGNAAQTLSGNATINLNDADARFAIDGTGTTTLASGVTVRGQGNIGQAINLGGINTLVNNGLISADVAGGTLNLVQPGNSGSVVNHSNLQAINGGTLQIATDVANASGLIRALAGSTVVLNGVTIDGGTLATAGSGTIQSNSSANNVLKGVALAGTLDLTTIANSRQRIVDGATINGTVNIGNGGSLALDAAATTGANQTIGGTGSIRLNGSGAELNIDGTGTTTLASGLTVSGQGTIGRAINIGGVHTLVNNGLILADGGTLTIQTPGNSGTLAGSGTLQASGGALNLATASDSTQGRLVIGAAGSTLGLGNTNLVITNDYTNAQAGTGNAFDRRAGVSGTGKILAGGDAAQVITGSNVSNGATTNATLTLGNMRVGTTTYDYQVANVGTSGPTLRGAIQTNVNGASLTDSRLSGAGVTAGSYVTGAPGSNTGSLAVTFTAANAGALAPLVGQSINLRSNFENIADQKLDIVFANGAAAYNAAIGSATSPVQVANQRVGGSNTAGVAIANTALAGSFSEDLNASVGGTSGMAVGSGAINGRVAGTSNTGTGAINVGVDTSAAGARTGTVTVNYQTAGTVNGVSNGLGTAGVGSQAVTVNGNVYQAAAGAIQTAALNFGTVQVGQSVSQNLVIRNTATGPSGFVEDLNAGFGGTTGASAALISGTGALTGVLAGANSSSANGTMTVSVNTSAAGAISGGINVNYQTAGAVGGVSNGLGLASAGSQNYGVSGLIQATGNVINQASPLINTPTIDFGAMRVGAAAPTANVSITNVATTSPQAALNASIASNGLPVTASGAFSLLAPGATNVSQLQVGLNTATAGNFTGAGAGSATVSLVSDASNVGNCAPNCQLTLASQQVTVSGKVYTPAIAQVNTTVVDFGIVHTGDVVAGRSVSVTNAAATTALNDTMTGSFGGATGPFTAAGTLAGVAAQATNATSFVAGINTASAGVFTGSASVALASHDADLADVSLGSTAVTLKGQVNNYAEASLAKTSGSFALGHAGNVYTIDFGNLALGAADLSETLAVLNSAVGPADILRGLFDTSGVGSGFILSGFGAFNGLAAGDGTGAYAITFDSAVAGTFVDTITLHGFGSNASGYDAAIGDTTLVLRGTVLDGTVAPVPEPETYALMLAGLALVGGAVRKRRRIAAATPR